MFRSVSVIVPAYNEANSLTELYDRVAGVFAKSGQSFEFILVDDGSADETEAVMRAMCARHGNIVYIRHFRNQGKSLALMQGFDCASGEVAITMDADLQDVPEMIPRFLDALAGGCDFANGWRKDRQDRSLKKFFSRLYNRFVSYVFDCDVHDINCGFKAYRREVYRSIDLRGDLHRLVPVLVALKAFTITEVPIEHAERRYGESKYSLFRHRGLLDVLALLAVHASHSRPFHVFCEAAFGFWLFAAGCLAGWLVLARFAHDGDLTLRTLGTVLGGLGTWAAFVGTVLPLFGLFLEIESSRVQDVEWRRRLVKKRIGPGPMEG